MSRSETTWSLSAYFQVIVFLVLFANFFPSLIRVCICQLEDLALYSSIANLQNSSMASQPAEPVYRTPVPFFTRLVYAGKLYLSKFAIKVIFCVLNLPGIRKKAHQPTFTKVYPIQPSLRHRIFVPKQWKHGDALLPLYLDIHGGGFALLEACC
jgi:hypothetical protein